MSNGLSIIFTCFFALFDIVFMKHNVVYVFVILVEDVYCVAIHDLSPVLTALFSFELGGFNSINFLKFIKIFAKMHFGVYVHVTCNLNL